MSNFSHKWASRSTEQNYSRSQYPRNNDEHGQVLGRALDWCTDTANDCTCSETGTTTESTTNERDGWDCAEASAGVCCVEEVQGGTFWFSKIGAPALDGLETIHHWFIETGERQSEGNFQLSDGTETHPRVKWESKEMVIRRLGYGDFCASTNASHQHCSLEWSLRRLLGG